MNSANQDKGKSASNLQKLFSSHVLENYTLKRQKSGLDHEKRKKLKELTNNEQLFLRKYNKYLAPGSRGRRSSIDAELARAIETNYSARSRPQSQIADKSFAKDSITDECPYSLETWNKLVDSETNIIDKNKQDILFGDETPIKTDNDSDNETEMILDEMFRTNISILESGKRLQRRQTLKPIETINNNFNEDAIDEEILDIQFRQKKRGRRHSVALGAIAGGQLNRDTLLKLPSITERNGSFSERKNSFSDPDFKILSGNSKMHSSDENISQKKITKSGRRLSLADGRTEFNMPSPVLEMDRNAGVSAHDELNSFNKNVQKLSLAGDSTEITKPVPFIQIADSDESHVIREDTTLQRRNTPRPVANATIFVQDASNDVKSSIFDTTVKTVDTGKADESESEQKQKSSFLPKIEITASDELEIGVRSSDKHVSFENEENHLRDRSDSICSKRTEESDYQPRKRSGRRYSLGTASLKLLVDSHHGAAKLRYIARLAHEMEKEEIAKHTPEPEPDVYKELNDCRYLRVVPRKGSAQSRDSEVI